MKIEEKTVFTALHIEFTSIDEVRELQAILAKVEDPLKNIRNIRDTCMGITGVPMSGLYSGIIRRMHP